MLRALLVCLLFCAFAAPTSASEGRYASIIVDADSLDILHARQIDAPRHPASLTKIMTLHLTFEAIDQGRITLDRDLVVSANAARTPPVKMGLRAGQSVSVDTLVQAIAVRSSNDAAVVLAEALAGSEAAFAQAMTDKARELGMRNTVFRNANGLPDDAQITSARDMAKLAHATLTRFPQHYHYFGQTEFRGRKSTNGLLSRPDVDGFKTGYTRASGYNLVISGTRSMDGAERRLIAVVLGGASKGSRNQHMGDLIERGFDVMAKTQTKTKTNTQPSPASPIRTVRREPVPTAPSDPRSVIAASARTDRAPVLWAVQYGAFAGPAEAEISAEHVRRAIGAGHIRARSEFAKGQPIHSARIEGLTSAQARDACTRAQPADGRRMPCRMLSLGPAGSSTG